MTINANDDYEKLAKLLYPSIEASGNVYYGQTKKLLMDEVLGKNDLGFESHIDSIRVEDGTEQGWHYETYFIWKLGPFKGSVKVGDLESFPLGYAKYKLVFSERTVDNVTSAGTFPTYKQDFTCEFDSIVYTTTDPIDFSKQWDGREFYIDDSGSDKYLLVTLVNTHTDVEDIDEYTRLINTPLCITNIGTANGQINVTTYTTALSTDFTYKYSYTNNSDYSLWTDIQLGSAILLNAGQSIYIKGHRLNMQSNESYFNIGFNGGDNISLEVSGNVNSLLDEDRFSEISDLTLTQTPSGYPIGQYTFYKLFYNNGSIADCSKLLLPAKKLIKSCYEYMFSDCSLLRMTPKLPALNLAWDCYSGMFARCTSLHIGPILKASKLEESCYSFMFNGCSALKYIKIIANSLDDTSSMYSFLTAWLGGAGDSESVVYYNGKADYEVVQLIMLSTNWTLVDIYNEIIDGENNHEEPQVYNPKYLTVFGADSDQNGKGKLDGDGDYETSFDEHGTHPMNSYNPDGSYNQEVWGYKSFNSPVQFRNGIYCGNIYDYNFSISSYSLEFAGTAEFKGVSISTNGVSAATGTKSSIALGYTGLMGGNDESEIYVTADTIYIGRTPTEYYATISDSSISLTADEVNISNLVVNNYDRVVTTHIAGSETTGEEQTIYGEKTFYNTTEFTTNVRATSLYVNFLYSKTSSWPIDINSDLVPANNYDEVGAVSLGSSSKFYLNAYTNTLHSHTMKADTIMSETSNQNVLLYSHLEPKTADINLGSIYKFYSNTYTTTLHSDLVSTNAITSETANSSVKLQSDLVPNTNNTYDLGSYSYHFNQIWSSELRVTTLNSIETGEDFKINLKKALVPASGFSIDLGIDGNKFSTVYAKNLDGCIPYAEYDSDAGTVSVPIGSIIGVSSNGASYDITGKIVTVTASTIPIATTIGGASPIYIPAGKYVVLIPISTVLALLMRIE